MLVSESRFRIPLRAPLAVMLLALGLPLGACANMSDSMTTAFADPAKYELYDCKQLEPERKNLAKREAELQGLMAKADTGFAGPVVAEMAYRNDYISVRGQAHFAEEAWRRNHCTESPSAPAGAATGSPSASGPKPALHTRSSGAIH